MFKPFNNLVMYSLFVISPFLAKDRWGDISRPIGHVSSYSKMLRWSASARNDPQDSKRGKGLRFPR